MPLSAVFHTSSIQKQVAALSDAFAIAGEFLHCDVINSGHINMTFRATYRKPDGTTRRFLFQREKDGVFPCPKDVMHNVEKVTNHIRWKMLRVLKTPFRQTLNLYSARGGRKYLEIPGSGFWRCYNCIENTHTFDVADHPRQAYEAARAFGAFQQLLCDMNPEDIHETIPFFHHTRRRFDHLEKAAAADSHGRLNTCRKELDFIRRRERYVDVLLDLQERGELPVRIVHNDTKINNVMLDRETDKAVCVIDLDTVMPGLSINDFGDSIRFGAATAAEDERDLSRMEMSLERFRVFTRGYVRSCPGLTQKELELLPLGAKTMTMECGVRFLTDYLDGDHYFAVHRDGQNLDRARTQFRLVADMEKKWNEMQKIVAEEANKER